MRSIATKASCLAALLLATGLQGGAQAPASAPAAASKDPRVGLKGGYHDAAVAVSNMVLVTNVPKPESFSDPKGPMGMVIPPETPESEASDKEKEAKEKEKEPAKPESNQGPPGLNFSNSDMAFRKNDLFLGNFNGFNVYDVDPSKKAALLASVVCPGGQGDMSVHGNLLFMSVEQTRGRLDCGTQGVDATVSPERFRGVRIFDISDIRQPKQVADIQTCRGSHTHTLVIDPKDHENVYVYGSGTSTVRSGEELAGCSGLEPKEDPNTALFSIDVIQVPLAAPEKAKIVNRPRIFADPGSGAISGLWPGGDHGPGTQKTNVTNQCHDITVFPEVGLAAGACSGNGILLDISDPVHPVRLDQVVDKNFAYWHSATFNNDGTKVIFTDEWGGGVRPRCRATDLPNWGADAIFDIVDHKLHFASYYKMPAPQTDQENCVAHNGSLIPVPGRDIMVQAWYQGGVSVFDFTDSAKPVEIAYFDRGPIDPANLILGGFWSTYWYNGRIYGSEIARGLDVFTLTPSEYLSQDEIAAASAVHLDEFNAQLQPRLTWPATSVVARAYLDQLTRSKAVTPENATAIKAALEHRDKAKLKQLAGQLDLAASAAAGRDAARLRSLSTTLKGLGA
jgi:hypothetical protein